VSLYLILKFVHVLLAIIAIGFNASYPIWLSTFWIAAALVLYVLLIVGGLLVYSPTLKGQIAALEASGPASPEYGRLSQRGTVVGILLAVDVVVIVFLMVVKPTL